MRRLLWLLFLCIFCLAAGEPELCARQKASVVEDAVAVLIGEAARDRATRKSPFEANTPVLTTYTYNSANQLTAISGTPASTFTYDLFGNPETRTIGTQVDTYSYDYENRLIRLESGDPAGPGKFSYAYDYRTRRVEVAPEVGLPTQVVFSGGTSVREMIDGATTVEYVRGSDMGGGVGGILYSLRSGLPSFAHYNWRGDVIARTDATGSVTWQANYEAFGRRVQESGTTLDRQKANTKEEAPTGFLNEGFRYRDLATGTFITRDPAGLVDGPNLYTYVRQNPWSKFDPEGLFMFGLYDSAGDYASDVGTSLLGLGTGVYQAGRGAVVGLATSVANLPSNTMGVINDVRELSQMDGGTVMQGVKGAAVQGGQSVSNFAAKSADTMVNGTLEEKSQLFGNALGNAAMIAAPFAKGGAVAEAGSIEASAARTVAKTEQAVAEAPFTKCFAAGTNVQTPDGEKDIEDIRQGESVYTAVP